MKQKLIIRNEEVEYEIVQKGPDRVIFEYNNKRYEYSLTSKSDIGGVIGHAGKNINIINDRNYLQVDGVDASTLRPSRNSKLGTNDDAQNEMSSPMPGKIVKVLIDINSKVKKGDGLIIMEAMKMEHTIKANADGTIKKIYFEEGCQVEGSVVLIEIDSE